MMIYDGLVVQGKDTQILIILGTTMYPAIHSKKKKFRNLITHQAQLPWPFHSHYNVSQLNLWIACWIAIAIWTFRRSSEHSEPLNIVSEHSFPAIWTFRRSSPWTFRNAASNCSTNDYLCMCVLCVWAICATLLPVRPSWFSISTCHYSLSPLYRVQCAFVSSLRKERTKELKRPVTIFKWKSI